MDYKTLEAWKASMLLVKEIYILARSYPRDEIFGLTSQTKRASVSIPTNIAEGMGRKTTKDTAHFLIIARGSVQEVETLLLVATMTAVVTEEQIMTTSQLLVRIMQLINGLLRYYEQIT